MKAKRVWIATHNKQKDNREISFVEPMDSHVWIYSESEGEEDYYAMYKQYILLEIEE